MAAMTAQWRHAPGGRVFVCVCVVCVIHICLRFPPPTHTRARARVRTDHILHSVGHQRVFDDSFACRLTFGRRSAEYGVLSALALETVALEGVQGAYITAKAPDDALYSAHL